MATALIENGVVTLNGYKGKTAFTKTVVIDELRILWLSNLTVLEISKKLGVSASFISRITKKLNMPPRHGYYRRWTAAEIEKMRAMRAEGSSTEEIAEALDRTRPSISRALNQHNIFPPSASKITYPDTFQRRDVTFFPPPWDAKHDEFLFRACRRSYVKTGCVYAVICKFAASHGLTIDAVQRRFHLIAKVTL